MTRPTRLDVPRQGRLPAPLDEVERAVARTADLVLKLSALAERYERLGAAAERVLSLRGTVERGRRALLDLAGPERPAR